MLAITSCIQCADTDPISTVTPYTAPPISPLTSFFASIKANGCDEVYTGGLQIETTPFQLKRTSISAARQPQAPEGI